MVATVPWQEPARSGYPAVYSIVRTAVVCSRIRSRLSAELWNRARLTSVRGVSSRVAFRVTLGRSGSLVVTSWVTVSSLVGGVTTRTVSAGEGRRAR